MRMRMLISSASTSMAARLTRHVYPWRKGRPIVLDKSGEKVSV